MRPTGEYPPSPRLENVSPSARILAASADHSSCEEVASCSTPLPPPPEEIWVEGSTGGEESLRKGVVLN